MISVFLYICNLVSFTGFHPTLQYMHVGTLQSIAKCSQQVTIITFVQPYKIGTQLNVVTSISIFGCTPRQAYYTVHYSSSHCEYTDVNKTLRCDYLPKYCWLYIDVQSEFVWLIVFLLFFFTVTHLVHLVTWCTHATYATMMMKPTRQLGCTICDDIVEELYNCMIRIYIVEGLYDLILLKTLYNCKSCIWYCWRL